MLDCNLLLLQAAGQRLVEFRRANGECLKFHEAYKKLRKSLSDLICDKNDETEPTDNSFADEIASDNSFADGIISDNS